MFTHPRRNDACFRLCTLPIEDRRRIHTAFPLACWGKTMSCRFLGLGLSGLALVVTIPSRASADLILNKNIAISATAPGPANTLVTIHNPADSGIESGCINQSGSLSSCLNDAATHVSGGDNISINHVLTF